MSGVPVQARRRQALAHAARQLCSSCPLWAECLRDSVAQSDPGGYAAATTRQDRRWIRRQIGIGDAQGRLDSRPYPGDRLVEVDVVLDAFDALQEHRASRPALSRAGAVTGKGSGDGPRSDKAHRVAASGQPHVVQQHLNTREASMAAPAGERITFSLDDPVQGIQKALLGPLVHSTLPTLEATGHIAALLVRTPSSGLAPELLEGFRRTRRSMEAWRAASGDEATQRPAVSGLTGSVSVELATTDPLSALRQDVFEPLLHLLAESIRRMEALTAVLIAAPDDTTPSFDVPGISAPHGRELADLHAALCELGSHIEEYAALAPRNRSHSAAHDTAQHETHLRSVPAAASGKAHPPAAWTTPSLRRAVEEVVTSFPGPFTGRDVLLALPPGAYQDPAKSVSNVLCAMAKSGRLLRMSRGTYAVSSALPTGVLAASS
ncbi:WhiB family transcriptional regulator [Streptomyces sp. NBC_01244]|uniref:WhiB family transcriptional regulator n=1 Tax=Streptomyces sp. NBC_01244 TaxID=2903797 RepID=UPI002E1380A3|nr:WhiB family transcriptional regulator [Streptomyces sp. NBC_01244]